jgi:hypothetical protein
MVPAFVLHIPSPAAAQAPTSVWNADVGVHGSWYDDPLTGTTGQPGYVEGVRMGLGYTLNSPRTQVAFTAYAMGVAVQGTGQSDHINYAGALAVTRAATPRLTWRFSEAVVSVYSNGAPLLATNGLIYPLALTTTNDISGGFTYELTTRTSLTLQARHEWVGFNSTPGLTNGWQFKTSASLARQLTPTDSVDVSYSFRHSDFPDQPASNTDTNALTVGWTRQLSEHFSFSADAGVAQLSRVNTPSEHGFVADATFTEKVKEGSVSFRYSHGFSQAYGFGRDRVYDTAGLVYDRTLTRDLSGTLAGVYGRSRDPYDPLYGFDTQDYSLALKYVLARGWSLGASYAWLYLGYLNVPARSTNNVNVSLSYGWEWR